MSLILPLANVNSDAFCHWIMALAIVHALGTRHHHPIVDTHDILLHAAAIMNLQAEISKNPTA